MRLVVRLLTIFAVVSAAPAWAGGLWLYEGAGTPDLGTAAAGRAALAQDASTGDRQSSGDDEAGSLPDAEWHPGDYLSGRV